MTNTKISESNVREGAAAILRKVADEIEAGRSFEAQRIAERFAAAIEHEVDLARSEFILEHMETVKKFRTRSAVGGDGLQDVSMPHPGEVIKDMEGSYG